MLRTPVIKITKFEEDTPTPSFGTEGAAGLDLCSNVAITVPPGGRLVVPTGIAVTLPRGTYGRVAGRSGLAARNFVTVLGGVIDPDYCGEVKVILANLNTEDFKIERGDRIAQLICEQYVRPKLLMTTDTRSTTRGTSGFGSTGV